MHLGHPSCSFSRLNDRPHAFALAPACPAGEWLKHLGLALPSSSSFFINYAIIHGLCINLFRFVWCAACVFGCSAVRLFVVCLCVCSVFPVSQSARGS